MAVPDHLDFDFDFSGTDRAALLDEANRTAGALAKERGARGEAAAVTEAPIRLLAQLNQVVAEFSAYPEVLQLREEHFTAHGLAVPVRFRDLNREYRFYWVRFPVTLKPLEGKPFNKLECAVEFNPGVVEGHLRPRAQMILPDKKFRQLLEFSDSLELRIGESFEFDAATGDVNVAIGTAEAKGAGQVDAKVAGKLGLIAGPFTYRLKRAQLDHSPAGTEKVFWKLDGTEFFQEDDPTLVVVLQVPRAAEQVKIAAALQAYHRFNLLAATLGETLNYFRERLANFFHKGAPTHDTHVWDITPNL